MSTEATDTTQDPNQMDEAALERATAPNQDKGKEGAGTQDPAKPEPEKLAATPPETVKQNANPPQGGNRPQPGQRGNDRGHHQRKHDQNQRAQGAPEVPERIGGIKGFETLGQPRQRPEPRTDDRRQHQAPPQDRKEERPAMSTTQTDPNESKKLDLEIEKAKSERIKLLSPRLEAAERMWNIDKPLGAKYFDFIFKNL